MGTCSYILIFVDFSYPGMEYQALRILREFACSFFVLPELTVVQIYTHGLTAVAPSFEIGKRWSEICIPDHLCYDRRCRDVEDKVCYHLLYSCILLNFRRILDAINACLRYYSTTWLSHRFICRPSSVWNHFPDDWLWVPSFMFTVNLLLTKCGLQYDAPLSQSTRAHRTPCFDSRCVNYLYAYHLFLIFNFFRDKSRLWFWIWHCSASVTSSQPNCCQERASRKCNGCRSFVFIPRQRYWGIYCRGDMDK